MRGADSYAALGLRPGAGRAEVDEAYRRLIKRYHPDRTGGDCSRAAEINRAYTQLRRDLPAPAQPRSRVPVATRPPRPPARRRRGGWALAAVIVIAAGTLFAMEGPRRSSSRPAYDLPLPWTDSARPAASRGAQLATDFEQPLHSAVIDRAIADAVQFHRAGDLDSTLEFSRACHNSLREKLSLNWFDACAAFDEATVTLNGDDSFADSGPFNTSVVIARQIGAARQLSGDILLADSRLHAIRSRVDLALLPRLDEAAARPPP